jgi:glycosyltransferase involved in cell wall biosynthesis
MNNKISVIVAVYNAEKTIANFLDSYINVNYTNKELIIINNNSNDNTNSIISLYLTHINFYINEPDLGIYDAWNKGVKVSTGEWVSFIGADDIFESNCFNNLLLSIENLNTNFVTGKINLISKNSCKSIGTRFDASKILFYQNFAHIGSITKKQFILDFGLFDTKFKIAGDYDFYLKNRFYINAGFTNNIICYSKYGVSQTNFNTFIEKLIIWHKYKIHFLPYRYFLFLKNVLSFYLKILCNLF